MLIRNAEIDGRVAHVRIENGVVAAIGAIEPEPGAPLCEAAGGALLPGLHDHHIHLAAFAAARASVRCGPPEVRTPEALAAVLDRPGTNWLRGVGYHESVAGLLDAAALDGLAPGRPVRVQHRSGRMWFFNSAALDRLLASAEPSPALERIGGRFTGRLFDDDLWLRAALGARAPSFDDVGALLAGFGVTGVTEMSPKNDAAVARHFRAEQARGALPQNVLFGGALSLDAGVDAPALACGPAKLHLHEEALPVADGVRFVRAAHAAGRVVAVHAVTEAELVFALATFDEAGVLCGDRIEHAAIAAPRHIDWIARLGLCVVTQPHFIAERGEQYAVDLAPESLHDLYRLRAFLDAGVPLAAGGDAPFGGADPWAAMAAATTRRTGGGRSIGPGEALSPEEALSLFLRDPADLSRTRRIAVGAAADFCLLDQPWSAARTRLSAEDVAATFIGGALVSGRRTLR